MSVATATRGRPAIPGTRSRQTTALAVRYRAIARCAPTSRTAANAMERLWASCEGLCWAVARRVYRPCGAADMEDLVQSSFEVVASAARLYQPGRCGAFGTYLTHTLRRQQWRTYGEIATPIRVPAFAREALSPSYDKRPARRAVDPATLMAARRVLFAAPVPLMDHMRPDDPSDAASVADEFADAVAKVGRLPAAQARAIRLRFGIGGGEPLTYSEVGAAIGRSRDTAIHVINAGLKSLRKFA